MLSIPNQLEGAYVGQDVMLECHTEAYPASINYWTTERGDMIISGEKMVENLCEIEVCEINCEFSCLKLVNFSPFLSTDTSRAGDKFETISTNNGYSKYMKLKIRNVGPNDFGFYRCVAKNSLGELKSV
jgi:neurotrimin